MGSHDRGRLIRMRGVAGSLLLGKYFHLSDSVALFPPFAPPAPGRTRGSAPERAGAAERSCPTGRPQAPCGKVHAAS